jgi:uncharacterized protein (TIGR02271 family)
MTEHIVAVFDTHAAADAAACELENAGFPAAAIRRYTPDPNKRAGDGSTLAAAEPSPGRRGFWAWLLGEDTETTRTAYPHDEDWYERRVTTGGAVLSVTVDDDSRIHQATGILEAHRPVEIEESTEEHESSTSVTRPGDTSASAAAAAEAPAQRRTQGSSGTEEVIPLAQEELEVGKRRVDRGSTRIRRYVVETPVEREVTLHGERVTVERRRPIESATPERAFEERTVEVRETEEVPVVQKTAHVTEEVVVHKEQTQRTDTVRDTVRRDEVEIQGNNGQPSSDRH